MEYLYVETRI